MGYETDAQNNLDVQWGMKRVCLNPCCAKLRCAALEPLGEPRKLTEAEPRRTRTINCPNRNEPNRTEPNRTDDFVWKVRSRQGPGPSEYMCICEYSQTSTNHQHTFIGFRVQGLGFRVYMLKSPLGPGPGSAAARWRPACSSSAGTSPADLLSGVTTCMYMYNKCRCVYIYIYICNCFTYIYIYVYVYIYIYMYLLAGLARYSQVLIFTYIYIYTYLFRYLAGRLRPISLLRISLLIFVTIVIIHKLITAIIIIIIIYNIITIIIKLDCFTAIMFQRASNSSVKNGHVLLYCFDSFVCVCSMFQLFVLFVFVCCYDSP